MEEHYKSLTDKEVKEFNQYRSLVEFCHRFWYSLDDVEDLTEESRKVVAELLWENLFSIISPFLQVIMSHDRCAAAEKEKKWEYISPHDFECVVDYIEFEKTKWEEYALDKAASIDKAKKLFNKIIKHEYFKEGEMKLVNDL